MKKILLIIPLLFLSVPSYCAFWDFITKPLRVELAAVKNEVAGDINGVKANVEKLADVTIKMQAQIKVQAVALAGVNNTVSEIRTTVGRDQTVTTTTTTSNDSDLMKYIIDAQRKIIIAMVGIVLLIIRQLFKFISKYMFYKEQTLLKVGSQAELDHLKVLQGKKPIVEKEK